MRHRWVPRLVLTLALVLVSAARTTSAAPPRLDPQPVVTLNPSHGPAGTTIQVSACDFPGNIEFAALRVTVDQVILPPIRGWDDCGAGIGFGVGSRAPAVPVDLPTPSVGPHTITVDLVFNGVVESTASAVFTVDRGATVTALPTLTPLPTRATVPTSTPAPAPAGGGLGSCHPKDVFGQNVGGLLPEWTYVNPSVPNVTVDAAVWAVHPSSEDFPSNHATHDLNFFLILNDSDRWLLSPVNISKGNDDERGRLEVEWETGMIPEWAWPSLGDRVRVGGAWIYDCGHLQTTNQPGHDVPMGYASEIHAPNLVVTWRQEPSVSTLGSSVPLRHFVPVTRADIYAGAPPSGCTHSGCAVGSSVVGHDEVFDVLPPDPGFGQGKTLVCHIVDHAAAPGVAAFTRLEPRVQAIPFSHSAVGITPARCQVTLPFAGVDPATHPLIASSVEAGYTQSSMHLLRTDVQLDSLHLNDAITTLENGSAFWHLWINLGDQWLPLSGLAGIRAGDTIPINQKVTLWSRIDQQPHYLQLFAAGYAENCIDSMFGRDLTGILHGLVDRAGADYEPPLLVYVAQHLGTALCIAKDSGDTGNISISSCLKYPNQGLPCAEAPVRRFSAHGQPWAIRLPLDAGMYTAYSDAAGHERNAQVKLAVPWWALFFGVPPIPTVETINRTPIERAYAVTFHATSTEVSFPASISRYASEYIVPTQRRCIPCLTTAVVVKPQIRRGPSITALLPKGWSVVSLAAPQRQCTLGRCGGAVAAYRMQTGTGRTGIAVDILTYPDKVRQSFVNWLRGPYTRQHPKATFSVQVVANRVGVLVTPGTPTEPAVFVVPGKGYLYVASLQTAGSRALQPVDSVLTSLAIADGYSLKLQKFTMQFADTEPH